MHFLGATRDEVLFVALLVLLVLVAPKMPKIGERIGALFGSSRSEGSDTKPASRSGDDG
jgi:hypothetical protein